MRRLPEIRVSGAPFERGRQHGDQAGDLIRKYLDRFIDESCAAAPAGAGASRPTRADLLRGALAAVPFYEAFAPHLVEEIRGVAQGARISFAEAMLCNVRMEAARFVRAEAEEAEMAPDRSEGCTAFAFGPEATAGRTVIAGQNSDQSPWNAEVMVVLAVRPDAGPGALMVTHAGLIGYHGCNGAGVAQFANAVPPAGWRPAMPHYLMKRVLLEQRSADACVRTMLRARVASPANYVVADARGHLADVEMTPEEAVVAYSGGAGVVHTNHFEHPRLRRLNHGEDGAQLAGSLDRAERLRSLTGATPGGVTVESLKEALADHAGQSQPICRHGPPDLATVASIIAEVEHGRVHVAAGTPCSVEYVSYAIP
jgi:isopenicillin-N N-acyltransferase like protein